MPWKGWRVVNLARITNNKKIEFFYQSAFMDKTVVTLIKI